MNYEREITHTPEGFPVVVYRDGAKVASASAFGIYICDPVAGEIYFEAENVEADGLQLPTETAIYVLAREQHIRMWHERMPLDEAEERAFLERWHHAA
jgi:hypothetical protein